MSPDPNPVLEWDPAAGDYVRTYVTARRPHPAPPAVVTDPPVSLQQEAAERERAYQAGVRRWQRRAYADSRAWREAHAAWLATRDMPGRGGRA